MSRFTSQQDLLITKTTPKKNLKKEDNLKNEDDHKHEYGP